MIILQKVILYTPASRYINHTTQGLLTVKWHIGQEQAMWAVKISPSRIPARSEVLFWEIVSPQVSSFHMRLRFEGPSKTANRRNYVYEQFQVLRVNQDKLITTVLTPLNDKKCYK